MDTDLLLFGALFLYGYIVAPALAVYCWFRLFRSRRRASRKTRLSAAALSLATLALSAGVVAVAVSSIRRGAFLLLTVPHHSLYAAGIVISALALLVSLAGAFRPNPLRFKALLVALGSAVFWFLAGSGIS